MKVNLLVGGKDVSASKPIVRVNGVEEAISRANDNEYGLSAAVFGRDVGRVFDVARRIDSGICHINAPTVLNSSSQPGTFDHDRRI
jgi:benzaldehyde dehydrogenase (NAD)